MQLTFGYLDPRVPDAPGTAIVGVADGTSHTVGIDAQTVKDHLFDNPGVVTHLPGNDAILSTLAVLRDMGVSKVDWVSVDPQGTDPEIAADIERFFAEMYSTGDRICARGTPADVEDTHYTCHGPNDVYPPGQRPAVEEN